MIKLFRKAESAKVTFVLPGGEAGAGCSVVGDFNGWRPGVHQLRRRSNGTRSISVVLPLGTQIRFRYLGSNGHWFNDPDVVEFDTHIASTDFPSTNVTRRIWLSRWP